MGAFPTPITPTLDQISTNDFVNYAGLKYPVASVVSHSFTSAVIQAATVTITVGIQTVTLVLTSADTIVSETAIDSNGVAHTSWKCTPIYT